MAKVVIFGCGRGAEVAARYLSADSEHEIVGFTVEAPYLAANSFRGVPLVDFARLEHRFPPEEFRLFAPLGYQGMNALRAEKYLEGKRRGYAFISYVSSKVATHDRLQVGENCFILENNSINFDVQIGNNVVAWSGSQIGDESVIGDHVWLSSHVVICGGVTVGERSFLGANCTVTDGIRIADRTYIGAATLVSKSTKEGAVHITEGSKPVGIDSRQFFALAHGGR